MFALTPPRNRQTCGAAATSSAAAGQCRTSPRAVGRYDVRSASAASGQSRRRPGLAHDPGDPGARLTLQREAVARLRRTPARSRASTLTPNAHGPNMAIAPRSRSPLFRAGTSRSSASSNARRRGRTPRPARPGSNLTRRGQDEMSAQRLPDRRAELSERHERSADRAAGPDLLSAGWPVRCRELGRYFTDSQAVIAQAQGWESDGESRRIAPRHAGGWAAASAGSVSLAALDDHAEVGAGASPPGSTRSRSHRRRRR